MNFSLNWNIENYSPNFHQCAEQLTSPKFSSGPLGNIKWFLAIDWNKSENTDYISCFLKRHCEDETEGAVTINFRLFIGSHSQPILRCCSFKNITFSKDSSVGSNTFAKVSDIHYILKNSKKKTLIVRCLIEKLPSRRKRAVKKIDWNFKSKIGNNQHSFAWVVKYSHSSDWYKSKTFYLPETTPLKLLIFISGDNLLIHIYRIKEWPFLTLLVSCTIYWLDEKGFMHHFERATYLFGSETINDVWNFPTSVTINDVHKLANLYNNKFVLVCNFSVSNGIIEIKSDIKKYCFPSDNARYFLQQYSCLASDIERIPLNRNNWDVKFRIKSDEFRAHKSLLEISSPTLINNVNVKYSKVSETYIPIRIIEICDVNADMFRILLHFLYTGTVDNVNVKDIFRLFDAANKYNIVALEERCSFYLTKNLTSENVVKILLLAVKISDNFLKNYALYFMKNNTDFMESRGWQKLVKDDISCKQCITLRTPK